ncbi:hypothetical protein BU23DRAFT_102433 [Bimuria novae-zelandiae CBS 107.79]|uniref:F-box domain-containing protein n=1 Tax=Bimuria novae-zelandiae CBS 107.79 TaxID=1447943 RepID=A0A6A5W2I3_9PLEO|nr:hypothetical protein BU23DRAFT_102433 [Bimuria novae-zelandiae CBS 107.79]
MQDCMGAKAEPKFQEITQKGLAIPKREARALRRSLAEIKPENSNSQLQSPLYSILPNEVRNSVFEYAVCQVVNPFSKPETHHARRRPSHELLPVIDTSLLRTCRLVYYETRAIPLRSTTHHRYGDQAISYESEDWDHYLFHLSNQSGQHLYHLHTTVWHIPRFDTHLQQHMHWRRLTWTIYKIFTRFKQVLFPDSCREVNLEFETLRNDPLHQRITRQVADGCRDLPLIRRNNSRIEIDEKYTLEYTWDGLIWQPSDGTTGPGGYVATTYHVTRLCWRVPEPERNYMHYDHWDCLRSEKIKPAPSSYVSDNEGKG